MNRRELTRILDWKGASPLDALLDALEGAPIELRLAADEPFDKPGLAFELDGLARERRAAAGAALRKLLPRAPAFPASGPARLLLILAGRKPASAELETAKRTAFKRGCLGEPALDAALWAVHGLYPIAGLRAEPDGLALELAEPAPLPFFLGLDIAKPFAPSAGALADRLGNRPVRRIALRGGTMELGVL